MIARPTTRTAPALAHGPIPDESDGDDALPGLPPTALGGFRCFGILFAECISGKDTRPGHTKSFELCVGSYRFHSILELYEYIIIHFFDMKY